MPSNQEKLQIIIEAQNKANKEIEKLQKQLGWVQQEVANTTNSFKRSSGGIISSLKKIAPYVASAFAVNTIINFWKEAVELARKTEDIAMSFDKMTKNIWESWDDVLGILKEASKGTISEYDLMLAANKAMSLGVASNTEDFAILMEIARDKAKNMGLTSTQAFDDIVTGLGRWSPLILDNLGITVNATEAQELYAKSIGKSASELTEAEKKQAIINKVVNDGRRELAEMWWATLTAADRQQILQAKITDLKTEIWTAFLPVVNEIVDKFSDMVTNLLDNEEAMDDLKTAMLNVADWIIWTIDKISTFMIWLDNLASKTRDVVVDILVKWYEFKQEVWFVIDDVERKFMGMVDRVKNAINAVKSAIGKVDDWIRSAALQVANPIRNALWKESLPAWTRALWWPVSANTPYLVWERWPELFVPRSSGSIQPNTNLGGVTVSINGVSINNGMDLNNFKQMVEETVIWATRKASLWVL